MGQRRLSRADVLIGRALVFLALAGFVAAVYAAVVVGIGTALGRGQPDLVLAIVATGIVAVAFERVTNATQRIASRLAVLPFVAFYAAFDAIVGFATGLLVRQANGLSGAEQAAAAQQIQQYFDNVIKPGLPTLYVVAIGVVAWVVGMLAVAVARRRAGASGAAVALLAVAAVSFGFDHGFPTGTIGMAALFLAGLLLERQPVQEVEPTPATV